MSRLTDVLHFESSTQVNEKLVIPVGDAVPRAAAIGAGKKAQAPAPVPAPAKPAPAKAVAPAPSPAAPAPAKVIKLTPMTSVDSLDSGKTHTVRHTALNSFEATRSNPAPAPDSLARLSSQVGPGESLWEISDKHRVDLRALVELNGLRQRKYILVGEARPESCRPAPLPARMGSPLLHPSPGSPPP